MTRVFTVKSNARRECRKLGLDPDLVVPCKGGFRIRQQRAKRDGDPKRDRLVAMLADWAPINDLMMAMGWQAHTVRGALSTAAKARGIKIERQRVGGVSSYRVAPDA